MRTTVRAVVTGIFSFLFAVGVSLPASAVTSSWCAWNCNTFGYHAYVFGSTLGNLSLTIKGTNGEESSYTWPANDGKVRSGYQNSPTKHAKSAKATTSATNWISVGIACSL